MARTTGPLFGLGAAGGLAGSLTYSKIKGGSIAKRTPRKKGTPTGPERNARTAFQFLQKQWSLTLQAAGNIPAFEELGRQENLPAYNAYMKYNLSAIARGNGPTTDPTIVITPVQPDVPDMTFILFPGGIQWTFDINSLNDGWGAFIGMSTDATTLQSGKNFAAAADLFNLQGVTVAATPITGLPHGSRWRFTWWTFTLFGTIQPSMTDSGFITIP